MIEVKNFKIIDNYEEFKKYYILSRDYVQKQSPEQQEKTCKYFYKKIILLITKDGYILELENNPSINKTLWYDDERPEPKKTKQYFINYNIYNMPYYSINAYLEEKERLQKTGGASGRYDYNGIYLTNYYTNKKLVGFEFYDDKRYFLRYLDKEEEKELLQIIKDLQDKYLERLERYYKRYADKIHCSGYWVNR